MPNLGGVSSVFPHMDLAGLGGSKLVSLIFLSNTRWSALKHARVYSRLTPCQTFTLSSSMLQISSGRLIDQLLNYVLGTAWLYRIIFVTVYHSSRFIYFLPYEVIKKCIDKLNFSHISTRAKFPRAHMANARSGGRSEQQG